VCWIRVTGESVAIESLNDIELHNARRTLASLELSDPTALAVGDALAVETALRASAYAELEETEPDWAA
jgi:hypothetical protein